ncbi:MAG: ATP-binding protein [Planctomycetota bacterium]
MGGIYARVPAEEMLGDGGLTIVVAALAGAAIMLALMLLQSALLGGRRRRSESAGGAVQTQHMQMLEEDVVRLRAELRTRFAEAERTREELQAFAYAASHDLQAPLRHIGSFTQILVTDLGASLEEADRSNLDAVTFGVRRMRGMIDELLEYSRVYSRGGDKQPCDMSDILARVHDEIAPLLARPGASLKRPESLPKVFGDPDQLRQLFRILFENCVSMCDDDGPAIELRVDREERGDRGRDPGSERPRARLLVESDGLVAKPERCSGAFELFARIRQSAAFESLDPTSDPDEDLLSGGSLSIARRVVERHGGEIQVVPAERGNRDGRRAGGLRFEFTLPLV